MDQPLTSEKRSPQATSWHVIVGILLVFVLTGLLLSVFRGESPPVQPTVAVPDFPPIRLTEGWLSGQTAYTPYPTLLDKRHRWALEPLRASASFRDRALYHLLANDLDRAVADMEEAVRKTPAQPLLLSDLSVLYGERARAKNQPEDYVASLEMAERAVTVGPDIPEVAFNHALALEHLFLRDQAIDAWRHCNLINGMGSDWREEVKKHRDRLFFEDQYFKNTILLLPESSNIWPIAGTVKGIKGALVALHRNSDRLRALGEASKTATIQNQIASSRESLGQASEAWRYRYRALDWTSQVNDRVAPRGRAQPSRKLEGFDGMAPAAIALETFESAAQASIAQRRPRAALQFQTRAVSFARALGDPTRTVFALLIRSRIEAALGQQEAAKWDLMKALRIFLRRQNLAGDFLAAQIDLARREIADAEGRTSAIAYEGFVPEHLDQQADLDFRRGDTAAGAKSLESALDKLERQRTKVVAGKDRISFFDQAGPLYERLVALEIYRGRPEKALEVLERFRARVLLDQENKILEKGVGAAPLHWQDLQRRVPEHTVLAVYAVVDDRLITWLVRRSGIEMVPDQADWPVIASWIDRLQSEALGRRVLLAQLFGQLVAPWKETLGEGDRIIFVPTGGLYGVPFAALIDRVSGRFLIEEHAVGVAPSASEFVNAVERDRRMWARPLDSVLLVGDPVRSGNHELPPLPGSAREIQSLGLLYRQLDAKILTREQATPRRVLASLGGADIAHLSVHALGDSKDPMRSRLFLSSFGGDPGELSTRDLLRARLSRTRLVMLAACGSHAGPVSASEGSLSLAYSFLTAGVPAVVGSLWLVDDQSTARLSLRFHQELLRGVDALKALRVAQREEIARRDPLSNWTWASFQVYGGVEERAP